MNTASTTVVDDIKGWRNQAPQQKAYQAGTHRVRSPLDTMRWALGYREEVGITRVADVTGLDNIGIPVVMVCRPNSRSLTVSQGKGLAYEEAVVSGVMESIESYHAERVRGPLLRESFEAMRDEFPVVDPAKLPQWAGSHFDANDPTLWIEGHDIVDQQDIWVPLESVHTDFTIHREAEYCGLVRTTTGLASGNSMLEATSHGMLEVVERDARKLQELRSKQSLRGRRIRLESITDARPLAVLNQLDRAGLAVAVWDATSDVGIATIQTVIVDSSDNPWRHLYAVSGWGTHLSREVALCRALTEAVQTRLTFVTASRDDVPWSDFETEMNPTRVEEVRTFLAEEPAEAPYGGIPDQATATIQEDLDVMISRLKGVGVSQVVVVDLRRPNLGIPVVKVVIPELESSMGLVGTVSPGRRAIALVLGGGA